jgi:hypothetical protein
LGDSEVIIWFFSSKKRGLTRALYTQSKQAPRLDAGEATIGDSAGSGASLTFVSGKRKRQTTALNPMK